jgi:hypothetical protein
VHSFPVSSSALALRLRNRESRTYVR